MHLQTPLCSDIVLIIDKLSCDMRSPIIERHCGSDQVGDLVQSCTQAWLQGWGPGKLIPDWVILPLDFPPPPYIGVNYSLWSLTQFFLGNQRQKAPNNKAPGITETHTSPSTTVRCGEPAQTDQTKSNMLQIKLTALYFNKKINLPP